VLVRAAALTLPSAIAVGLVSVFTRPGATVLLTLGPFDATLEGVDFAAKVVVRLFAMAAALTLFGLTTTTRDLVVDLERRGVSPRLAFALGAVTAPYRSSSRARARSATRNAPGGLDTEGSLRRRLGGVLPLAGPVVIGSLHEVEARSLALEARAFGRPGRATRSGRPRIRQANARSAGSSPPRSSSWSPARRPAPCPGLP
jgi:energy-coupling factor transport system permease protein